jgi:ABC-type dipeptide/oligopeptide/nickel transport system permease component
MPGHTAKRLFYSILILLMVPILIFPMVRLIPAGPIRGGGRQNVDQMGQRIVQETRSRYGLDRPIPAQLGTWWFREFLMVHGGKGLP